MQELWYRPIVLLIVLAGIYFTVRTNRVFPKICIMIRMYHSCSIGAIGRCAVPMPRAY